MVNDVLNPDLGSGALHRVRSKRWKPAPVLERRDNFVLTKDNSVLMKDRNLLFFVFRWHMLCLMK